MSRDCRGSCRETQASRGGERDYPGVEGERETTQVSRGGERERDYADYDRQER